MGSRIKRASAVFAIVAIAVCCSCAPAFAGSVTYTSSSAFYAAIAGFSGVSTVNFDSSSVGYISQGTTIGNITFTSSLFCGDCLAIQNMFDTTSPSNYLGSTDTTTGAFFAGDTITFNFSSPVNALGLFVIADGDFNPGDLTLDIGSATATNSGSPDMVLGDGGQAFFIGIISTTSFTSATISYPITPSSYLVWNLDDITTGVGSSNGGGPGPTPEPSPFLLFAIGIGALAIRFRRL